MAVENDCSHNACTKIQTLLQPVVLQNRIISIDIKQQIKHQSHGRQYKQQHLCRYFFKAMYSSYLHFKFSALSFSFG